MTKLDNFLHSIIDRYLFQIALAVLVLISAVVRLHLAPNCWFSADYRDCLVPWVEHYRELGVVGGLASKVGNYYVPYNLFLALISLLPWEPWVMITLFSCIFDYLTAYFVYKLCLVLYKEVGGGKNAVRRSMLIGVLTLLLPFTALNSALWKQCDSVYTCFLVMSLYYVVREKYGLSFAMLGLSFIFKMQALFLVPLFVVLYMLRKKFSIFQFAWVPALYAVGGLPAILAGRRWTNVYGTYLHQMDTFPTTTLNFPNVYMLGLNDSPALIVAGILGTLAVLVFSALFIRKYERGMSRTNIVYAGIWFLWTCVMFVPGMHERYNYPVLILLPAFYLVMDYRKSWVNVALNVITLMLYANYLFSTVAISYAWMTIIHLALYAYVTFDFIREVKTAAGQGAEEKIRADEGALS